MEKLVLAKLLIAVLGLGFASIAEEIKSNTGKQVKRNVITGHTYYLKPGTDNISGTNFDDEFIADVGTLNNSDTLDGQGGYDILNAKINNDLTPAQIKNIEEINLTFIGNYTFGMDNVTEVKKLSVKDNPNLYGPYSLTIANINSTNIDTTIERLLGSTVTFTFTDNALSGSNDIFNIHLTDISSGNIIIKNLNSSSTNVLETLNLYSEGKGSYIKNMTVNPLKNLNIFGDKDLDIFYSIPIAENGVIDASRLNANFSISFKTSGIIPSTISFKGAIKENKITAYISRNDTINITTGAVRDAIYVRGGKYITINAGDGNNDINVDDDSIHGYYLSDDATVNITTGSGNDTFHVAGKSVTINAGDGSNDLYVSGIAGNSTIITGNGNDSLHISSGYNIRTGNLIINTGAGNDWINLYSYAGAAKIYLGEGKKNIMFGYSNFYHSNSTVIFTKDVLNKIPAGNFYIDYADIISVFNTADDKIDFSGLLNNKSIKGSEIYFGSISDIVNHSGLPSGSEFIVIDTSKDLVDSIYSYGHNGIREDSAIYYIKDGNGNGTIESNEIKLIAVVVNARLSKRNILGEEGIIEVNELLNKKDESINKGDESINKGTEIIDKGSEIINKGTEMINKLNNLINIFKR